MCVYINYTLEYVLHHDQVVTFDLIILVNVFCNSWIFMHK